MDNKETKNCPFCGEEIKAIAVKCRYCQSMLIESSPDTTSNDEEKVSEPVSVSATVEDNKSPNKNKLFIGIAVGIFIFVIIGLATSNFFDDRIGSDKDEEIITFDGGTYTGQVVNGVPEGYGIWEHQDGRVYKGEFKDGMTHGQGILTYPDGAVFEGEWGNGSLIEGTYSFEGYKYVGEFKDGYPHGHGTEVFSDGRIYVGELKDGRPHGLGKGTLPDVGVYEGEWKDGQYHGQGVFTSADGTVHEGRFEYGEYVGDPALIDNAANELIYYEEANLSFYYPSALAEGISARIFEDGCPWGYFPIFEMISFDNYLNDWASIYLIPIEDISLLHDYTINQINKLETYTANKNIPYDRSVRSFPFQELPVLPSIEAPWQFYSNVEFIDSKTSSGLRFLMRAAQWEELVDNNDISYYYLGITNDRKYYISAVFQVSHTGLGRHNEDYLENVGIDPNDWYSWQEVYEEYLDLTLKYLEESVAEDFEPSLIMLDEIIKSIQIE